MRKFLMLAMAVVLSLSSAFATTVYCKMTQSWWTTDGAAVGVHYWGGASAGTTWPGARMTSVAGQEGMWSYDVPSDVTGLMFVRVNGSGTIADWGAKTGDLTLPTDGKNLFTISNTSACWGGESCLCTGTWSKYTVPLSGTSVTYTVESTSKVNVTGTAPEGSSATYASTYTTKCQLTSGKSMTLTLSGFEGNKITGITLSMKSNKSGGKGSFTAVAGTTTIASIADAAFNTASWNGAWSQEYVDVIPTMTKSDYTVQKDENVVITIAASANSLYCQSFTVYYDKGATPPTPVDSMTLYFVNTLDWAKVNAFVWPATGDAYKAWPGEAAVKTGEKALEKDIYSYTFPATFVNAIFNNGTAQTTDLKWDKAKPYFVPGDADGEGKFTGTWYASKDDIPVPGKYYITGDSALVVDAGLAADQAWNPAAIKADADTTVLNLKANVDYKLKITLDGQWATALGYDNLSEKAEGLSADADGNICFKLAEAGAVQVIYFKEGDKVTYKLIGNFYVKPVIVETLNLVPNMWSEASAKMAAWVWGEDLAGAWTPFFAGEGDTLSVKINAEADSIIFVRFNSAVAAPTWDEPGTNIWNRVKDDKIDHVGLTYTITAWGDEGISVGQWTPYEPVVPGKYYITGDSALVVDAGLAADQAWNPAAIKADADTTVLNLKAGVDYKLKVTVDGTWATALGFDALSEKAEGLSADADGNICFKLAEAGAVQVIYFKEGDKVTYKLIGNFYVKPVIVETLNLVPNMWSEASAKMAAWVWGEDLAGAWTPFFAGEGDTLSVKINAEADSIIFVRFNSAVVAPTWDEPGTNIWNRVKDDKIDHVGLTYTITAWGDEGISVGQWTPYEPAGGCDWDNLPWLGSDLPAYAEQFKICLGDPKPGVVNIQQSFGTEAGIYVTFPSAAFGQISLSEGQYAIQGAGMLLYVSAFTAKETEVSVVCENVEYVFTVYNDKGGEPVCKDKYGLKVGETIVEFAKNEAQTEWVEYYKQGVELTAGDVIVLYNICEDQTFAAKVAGYEGLTPLVGGDGWTVTETAKYDFYLKLIYGADELYVVKQGDTPVEGKYFITGDSALVVDAGLAADKAWTPAAIKADADTTILNLKANVDYKLKITLDGTWNTALGYDALSEKAEGLIADADGNICFKLVEAGAVQVIYFKEGETATFKLIGNFSKDEPVCEGKYGLKVGDNVVEFTKNEAQTEWTEYYKQGVELTQGQFIALYNICEETAFTATIAGYEGFTPATGGWTVTETAKYDFYLKLIYGADELYVVKQGDDPQPGDKVYTIAGDEALVGVNWDPAATVNDMTKQADGSYILVKKNVVLEAKAYEYKVVEGHSWSGWQIPEQGNQTLAITAAGTYDVTFTLNAELTTLTADAKSVGPTPDPTVEVWGSMNEWSQGLPLTLSADKTTATITANIEADRYEFKIKVNGEWRSNAQTFTRQNNSAVGITIDEPGNMIFVADMTGNYTVTWTLATSALSIVYPTTPTAVENLVAPANEMRKVMIDGKLYILRDGKIYSVQGQLIR